MDAALVDTTDQMLGLLDCDGTVLRANRSLVAFFDVAADEIVGKPLWSAPGWEKWGVGALNIKRAVREAAAGKASHVLGILAGESSGGHSAEFDLQRVAEDFGLAPSVALMGRFDAIEKQLSSARALRLSQLYGAISETNKAVMRSSKPEEVYRAVCDACVRHCGFKLAWIGLHDPLSGYIIPVEAAGAAASYVDDLRTEAGPASIERHDRIETARDGLVPSIVPDIAADPDLAAWHAAAAAHGLACLVSLPLQRNGALFGRLNVYGGTAHRFDDEAVALLEEMADNVSFALDHFDREALRCHTEAALRASEARLQEAQAVGRIGDWELDRETGAMTWSPELFHLFERPLEMGAPDCEGALAYYEPDTREQTRARFRHAMDTGERCELEQTITLPSGAVHHHATQIVPLKDAEGRVYKLFGTVQDITERKLAEQQLRRKTLEIEDLYQNAPCGYQSVDADGLIIRINDTALNWLGYEREEVVGRMKMVDLLNPESQPLFLDQFLSLKQTGLFQSLELELIRSNGSKLPVQVDSTAILDADGHFVATRTMLSDNSARKQLEIERAAHEARLAELSRHMVDVQENERRKLAGELHDRASPNLAALQLTLSNLACALPASVLSELEPMLGDAQALLLDTAAGIREICTNLRPATLDYAGLIPALQDYAQQFARRTGIAVRLELASLKTQLLPNVQSLLFRIAQEALTNCAKHADAGTIHLQLAETADALILKISDDGVGFDSCLLGESGSKPGLGLITMKERAEFAGGRFTITSNPESGTEITVTFDLHALNTLWKTRQHPSRRASDRLFQAQPGTL
ncbi:PAS domain-containing protein [Azoarcus sp. PA01]|nr:PAS domain-containing protein [Azoarcus sp. PA01]